MNKHRNNLSLFQLIDRKNFNLLAEKWKIDKGVRSFKTWELTGALLECLTLKLESFRAAEQTLGIPKSTLSDALSERCSGFFQDLCDEILRNIRAHTKDRKLKRAIRQILALDSTEIDVHGSLFNKPGWSKKYSKTRQASLKLHIICNVDESWVEDFSITGSRKHDSPAAFKLRLVAGKTYVFDRAYNDLKFWLAIIETGSHFVTRLKDCPKLAKLRRRILFQKSECDGVLYDGFYEPSPAIVSRNRARLEDVQIRHIIYRDPETKKVFDFVTSDLKAPAQEIADIYKRRWAVELLFRWFKGHLGVRRLAIKNTNASEILCAAAVMFQLLLQLKKINSKSDQTHWQLLQKIRSALNRRTFSRGQVPDGCRWRPSTEDPFSNMTL